MGVFRRERRWRTQKRKPAADEGSSSKRRVLALYLLVGAVFAVLSVRLLQMQVIGGSDYRLRADGNRLRVVTSLPARGLIYDRAGRPLVTNTPVYTAYVVPGDLPLAQQDTVLQSLQNLLGVPAYQLEQKVQRVRKSIDPFQPVLVKGELDQQSALILAERRRTLPGVDVRYEATRIYNYSDVLGHVLGYAAHISEDEMDQYTRQGYLEQERTGKAGVELTYESQLRGVPGRRQVEVDASGKELRTLDEQPAKPGASIVLSIDAEMQKAVSRILADSLAGLGSTKAVAMVMDVRTGELLANVSLPTYDANLFSHPIDDDDYAKLLSDPNKPLLDHGIAEKFAPGSTFKQLTGVAALQEGVATPKTKILSQGALLIKREDGQTESYPDWSPNLGVLDFAHAIAMSSDIYFYCLAGGECPEFKDAKQDGLGNARLAKYARMFGFGELTGIDLPGETDGLVGDAEWLERASGGKQKWFLADTFFQGIGQGYIEATPLQVLRLTATIANGGDLMRPRVVHEVRDADGTVEAPFKPEVIRHVDVDQKNLQIMRDAMRLGVTEGTASKAGAPNVAIAAKTGTAEFGARLGAGSIYGRYKEHGWAVAFGPYENPEIAVVVFNEEGSGAITAAPTAGKIMDYYFNQRPKLAAR